MHVNENGAPKMGSKVDLDSAIEVGSNSRYEITFW
jgi:hypothetical protein